MWNNIKEVFRYEWEWIVAGVLLNILVWFVLFGEAEAASSDDYCYTMIFLGDNGGPSWDNGGEVGTGVGIGCSQRITGDWWGTLRYEHYSQLMAGEPFNNKDESSLDHFGFVLEYRW